MRLPNIRSGMRAILISLLVSLASAATASAQGVGIGVAAPLSGPSALLGGQMRQGAEAAAGTIPDGAVTLEIADDACTAEGGADAARRFVAAKVSVATGFLCIEAIEAAMPILKDADIPVVAIGIRADSLTDGRAKTGWPVFRLGPRGDGEVGAAAAILTAQWRETLFAIVDDGTIYGRDLAEGFRAAAEEAGLKAVFVDTFRPGSDNQIGLAGRLRKAGATHVFVGGDRSDIAILGRDALSLDYPLTIAGGETLRADPESLALPSGTLMIGVAEPADLADPALVARLRVAGIEPEGYVLPAFAGVQVAVRAALDARAGGMSIAAALSTGSYPTALGLIRFDAKGDLTANPFRLFRFDGETFREAE